MGLLSKLAKVGTFGLAGVALSKKKKNPGAKDGTTETATSGPSGASGTYVEQAANIDTDQGFSLAFKERAKRATG